jgi:hypothetical protein
MANTGLIKAVRPKVEDIRSPLFIEAYRIARAEDEQLIERDREILFGCMIQIAAEKGYNLGITDEQQASMMSVDAFLSLGLAEASEEKVPAAVALLRKHPLEIFVKLGQSLHEELREKAKEVHRRSVLKLECGLYGLLDPVIELEVQRLADPNLLIPERAEYQKAKTAVKRAEDILRLAGYFPVAHAIFAGAYYTDFPRRAYRRKNRDTPNQLGSVFKLFFRSYLLKALSEKLYPPPYLHHNLGGGKDEPVMWFLRNNFLTRVDSLRDLVSDTFFDPAEVSKSIPRALTSLEKYMDADILVTNTTFGYHVLGPFVKPPVKSDAMRILAREMTREVLTEFGEAVRVYYSQARQIDITVEDMNKFWYPRIMAWNPEAAGNSSEQPLPRVDESTIAAQSMPELSVLLAVEPASIGDYLAGAGKWPANLQTRFIQSYSWNSLFDSLGETDVIDAVSVAVEQLGSEIVCRLKHRDANLPFWCKAWVSAPVLREGILDLFRSGGYERKVTARSLFNALEHSWGVGGDSRLLSYLLDQMVKEQPGDYIEKGVSTEGWSQIIHVLSQDRTALRILWRRIPPALREKAIARFTGDNIWRIRRLLEP